MEHLLNTERWNIMSAHHITLFTHFKTTTKSIDIFRVLRCCVLMKNQIIAKVKVNRERCHTKANVNKIRGWGHDGAQ